MTYNFKASTYRKGVLVWQRTLSQTSVEVFSLTGKSGVEAGYFLSNKWNRQAHTEHDLT